MSLLIQPSFSRGELAPELQGRVDTAAYQVAVATAFNCFVQAAGGLSNRPGHPTIGPVKTHGKFVRIFPFKFSGSDTHCLEFGDQYLRVTRGDKHVFETAETISGATQANPIQLTITGHPYATGDEIGIQKVAGMTELNGRRFQVTKVDANTVSLQDQITGNNVDGTGFTAYTSGGEALRVFEIATPYLEADLSTLVFAQSRDVVTITHPSYDTRELKRTSLASWALDVVTFEPNQGKVTGLTAVQNGATGTTTYDYKVTAINDEDLEESLPVSVQVTDGNATLSETDNIFLDWTAPSGAGRYAVYRKEEGLFGLLGETEDSEFTDDGITPDSTEAPPKARDPLTGADNRPQAVGFFQQRRVFGGSNSKPDTNFFSQTGNFANLTRSTPIQADDAITATLDSDQGNRILHYITHQQKLIALTDGAEWAIGSGDLTQGFAPNTVQQDPQSAWGSSFVTPAMVGPTILFVQDGQRTVRSLGFSLNIDGFTGSDMTIMAGHIFQNHTAEDMAYAKRGQDPLVAVVRSDGMAGIFTFQQEQEVIGWTRWAPADNGKYESVAALRPDTNEPDEQFYFVVKRKIEGVTARFIERTSSRRFTDVRDAVFLDAGGSVDIPITIEDISTANPLVITSTAHGLADGDEIDIHDVEWVPDVDEFGNKTQPDQLNARRFTVANSTANDLQLKDEDGNIVDGSAFNDYVEGGAMRETFSVISGLWWLRGKTVAALADGNVVRSDPNGDPLVVSSIGQVTLPQRFSRAHVGLEFSSDVELLSIEDNSTATTLQARRKNVNEVTLRFVRSRGFWIGPRFGDMVEAKQRQFEPLGAPTELLTGDIPIIIPPDWNTRGSLAIRQRDPLPMTLVAAVPDLNIQPDQEDT